jgi:hypothetical protein
MTIIHYYRQKLDEYEYSILEPIILFISSIQCLINFLISINQKNTL